MLSTIKPKFNLKPFLLHPSFSTFYPHPKLSVVLNDLSLDINSQKLKDSVKEVKNIRSVQLQPGCAMHFFTEDEALKAAKYFEKTYKLKPQISSASIPSVKIENLPIQPVSDEINSKFSNFKPIKTSLNVTGKETVVLRFKSQNSLDKAIYLQDSLLNDPSISISEPIASNKPALFLRNIQSLTSKKILELFSQQSHERIHFIKESPNGNLKLAIVYFPTQQDALKCLGQLKDSKVDGVKLFLSYKEVAEPSVEISQLPEGTTEKALKEFFFGFQIDHVKISKGGKAKIIFDTPENAKLAADLKSSTLLNGTSVELKYVPVQDVCINLTGVKNVESIASLCKISPLVSTNTGIDCELGFSSVKDARNALNELALGKIPLTESPVSAVPSLSILPSYVLELNGLDVNRTYESLVDNLKTKENLEPFATDRIGIVTFNRHMNVVPGLKALKSLEINGKKLKIDRYRPLSKDFATEYDESSEDPITGWKKKTPSESLDESHLKALLSDNLDGNPETRLEILRNQFETQLFNAAHRNSFEEIFDSSLPSSTVQEAKSLFDRYLAQKDNEKHSEKDQIVGQLFFLFIQQQDQIKISRDLLEFSKFSGKPGSELFKLKSVNLDSNPRLKKLSDELKEHDAKAMAKQASQLLDGKSTPSSTALELSISEQADAESDKNKSEEDEEEKTKIVNFNQIEDSEGRLWSGAILHADTVQKTMPGNRVMRHRSLVIVGNLKGSGGFGMGKGKTPADATAAAFRQALRNIIHVDLYENAGLAHDLIGKHNSCRAYIRATPPSRIMVASDFASCILLKFGIASASVKLTGRREPYSMVRAIFNALQQHQNIDEYAKITGKRYLSLKWARDNGL